MFEIRLSFCSLLIITHLFLGCKDIKNLRFFTEKSSKVDRKICDSSRKNLQILPKKSAILAYNEISTALLRLMVMMESFIMFFSKMIQHPKNPVQLPSMLPLSHPTMAFQATLLPSTRQSDISPPWRERLQQ